MNLSKTILVAFVLLYSCTVFSAKYNDGGQRYFYNSLLVEAFNEYGKKESLVSGILAIDPNKTMYKLNLEKEEVITTVPKNIKCQTETSNTGVSFIIRPLFYGDVYLETEITIFNKENLGESKHQKCGGDVAKNISISSEQKVLRLIVGTPNLVELGNRMISFTLNMDE
jgi:hypothetical protein